MRILVLNGSPKREESDTLCITRAFLEGMREAGEQQVRLLHAVDQHIEPCTGCFACMHNGGTCIHRDDMQAILEEILQSDLLVLSFPLYCYGMPAPLKAIIDRTLPLSSMAMVKVGERYEHVARRTFPASAISWSAAAAFPTAARILSPRRPSSGSCFPRAIRS